MSSSRIRNIKWLGILSALASAIAAGASGDIATAVGIIGASLSSAGLFTQSTPSAEEK